LGGGRVLVAQSTNQIGPSLVCENGQMPTHCRCSGPVERARKNHRKKGQNPMVTGKGQPTEK